LNLLNTFVFVRFPGTSTFKPLVATPYAISQTIDQPSTSKNLPDIINRMEAGPSGELNRINRSPNTNRKIPEYTVPSTSHKAPIRVTKDTIEDWSDESMEGFTELKPFGRVKRDGENRRTASLATRQMRKSSTTETT
jgi:hypothetical protein